MRIGITCHATVGGSGAIAAALGILLAGEGHDVHFVCHDIPFGLSNINRPGITVHRVEATRYPPLKWPPYEMALAVKMVSVYRQTKLDLFHVHYAIPHAISAYLAREMVAPERLRIVCTLHGTDITLVGADPLYRNVYYTTATMSGKTMVTSPKMVLVISRLSPFSFPQLTDSLRGAPLRLPSSTLAELI